MSQINSKIIADSLAPTGERLTTYIVTFPRIVLAEFNTHRMFSRNSASSRAIPFKKMVQSVETNPFVPIAFQKDHTGMQGTEYFTGWREKVIRLAWVAASKAAVFAAKKLNKLGLTKQLVNRLLEPFMMHTVIVTSSEWENFFALRAHDAAEIHIAKLAELMLFDYNNSIPVKLNAGEWHIPFGDRFDKDKLDAIMPQIMPDSLTMYFQVMEELKVKIAVARCARVSYTVVGEEEKPDNYVNDIKLHDRLRDSGHFSPFEHCGRVMNDYEYAFDSSFNSDDGEEGTWGWSGNFRGFVQYRKTIAAENKKDARVKK